MIINPTTVDAFIARRGLRPLLSDGEWEAILQRIASLFGRELWHGCRLIHQAEDALRRHSAVFPEGVPQPYRFIYYLEFIAFPSPRLAELQQWLTERGFIWRERRQFDADTEREEVTGLRIYGYDVRAE